MGRSVEAPMKQHRVRTWCVGYGIKTLTELLCADTDVQPLEMELTSTVTASTVSGNSK